MLNNLSNRYQEVKDNVILNCVTDEKSYDLQICISVYDYDDGCPRIEVQHFGRKDWTSFILPEGANGVRRLLKVFDKDKLIAEYDSQFVICWRLVPMYNHYSEKLF